MEGAREGSSGWEPIVEDVGVKRGGLVSSCGEEGKRGIYEWLTEWDSGM